MSQRRTTISIRAIVLAIALAIALGFVRSASAVDPNPGLYQSVASGFWSFNSTWQVWNGASWQAAASYPQSGDSAIVRHHAVSLLGNAEVATLEVQAGGSVQTGINRLLVDAENGLTVEGVIEVGALGTLGLDGGGSAAIDGEVRLAPRLLPLILTGGALVLTSDVTLEGGGSIVGKGDGAKIRIGNQLVVTNHLTIQGALRIETISPSDITILANQASQSYQARIIANGPGTLALSEQIMIFDKIQQGVAPLYKADGGVWASAKLQFNRACDGSSLDHPILDGDFEAVNCGTLDCQEEVETLGELTGGAGGTITTDGPGLPCFIYNLYSFDETTICDSETIGSCP